MPRTEKSKPENANAEKQRNFLQRIYDRLPEGFRNFLRVIRDTFVSLANRVIFGNRQAERLRKADVDEILRKEKEAREEKENEAKGEEEKEEGKRGRKNGPEEKRDNAGKEDITPTQVYLATLTNLREISDELSDAGINHKLVEGRGATSRIICYDDNGKESAVISLCVDDENIQPEDVIRADGDRDRVVSIIKDGKMMGYYSLAGAVNFANENFNHTIENVYGKEEDLRELFEELQKQKLPVQFVENEGELPYIAYESVIGASSRPTKITLINDNTELANDKVYRKNNDNDVVFALSAGEKVYAISGFAAYQRVLSSFQPSKLYEAYHSIQNELAQQGHGVEIISIDENNIIHQNDRSIENPVALNIHYENEYLETPLCAIRIANPQEVSSSDAEPRFVVTAPVVARPYESHFKNIEYSDKEYASLEEALLGVQEAQMAFEKKQPLYFDEYQTFAKTGVWEESSKDTLETLEKQISDSIEGRRGLWCELNKETGVLSLYNQTPLAQEAIELFSVKMQEGEIISENFVVKCSPELLNGVIYKEGQDPGTYIVSSGNILFEMVTNASYETYSKIESEEKSIFDLRAKQTPDYVESVLQLEKLGVVTVPSLEEYLHYSFSALSDTSPFAVVELATLEDDLKVADGMMFKVTMDNETKLYTKEEFEEKIIPSIQERAASEVPELPFDIESRYKEMLLPRDEYRKEYRALYNEDEIDKANPIYQKYMAISSEMKILNDIYNRAQLNDLMQVLSDKGISVELSEQDNMLCLLYEDASTKVNIFPITLADKQENEYENGSYVVRTFTPEGELKDETINSINGITNALSFLQQFSLNEAEADRNGEVYGDEEIGDEYMDDKEFDENFNQIYRKVLEKFDQAHEGQQFHTNIGLYAENNAQECFIDCHTYKSVSSTDPYQMYFYVIKDKTTPEGYYHLAIDDEELKDYRRELLEGFEIKRDEKGRLCIKENDVPDIHFRFSAQMIKLLDERFEEKQLYEVQKSEIEKVKTILNENNFLCMNGIEGDEIYSLPNSSSAWGVACIRVATLSDTQSVRDGTLFVVENGPYLDKIWPYESESHIFTLESFNNELVPLLQQAYDMWYEKHPDIKNASPEERIAYCQKELEVSRGRLREAQEDRIRITIQRQTARIEVIEEEISRLEKEMKKDINADKDTTKPQNNEYEAAYAEASAQVNTIIVYNAQAYSKALEEARKTGRDVDIKLANTSTVIEVREGKVQGKELRFKEGKEMPEKDFIKNVVRSKAQSFVEGKENAISLAHGELQIDMKRDANKAFIEVTKDGVTKSMEVTSNESPEILHQKIKSLITSVETQLEEDKPLEVKDSEDTSLVDVLNGLEVPEDETPDGDGSISVNYQEQGK